MKNNLLLGLVATLALVAGVLLAAYSQPFSTAQAKYLQQYPQPRELPDFKLSDKQKQPFGKQQLLQHWTLTFVGYTFCPDICPTTLAELTRIYPQLKAIESEYPLQVLFISVDPARDTPERLRKYVNFFNDKFIAASGEHSELFPLVRSMGLMYSMADAKDNPHYLVDHSASIVLINPQAQIVGRFKPQLQPGQMAVTDAEQILADLPILLAGS